MPGNEQISSLAALGAEGAAPPDPPQGPLRMGLAPVQDSRR